MTITHNHSFFLWHKMASTAQFPPGTISQNEVARIFLDAGIAKHNTRIYVLFLKAFMAGVLLSFGNLLSEIVSAGSPSLTASNPGLVKLLSGFVFPIGLVMIVLNGQELLTSSMLVFPMAVMKRAVPWWGLPYNWIVGLFGNLTGSLFFGAILVKYTGVVSADPYLTAIKAAAVAKAVTPSWHEIFLRGIGCNWLVSIAVWQAAGSREVISKVVATWVPIWVFVACSFDHVVANMYSIPVAIMLGAPITPAYYIRKSLIAAFLGNVVGALFVALPYTLFYLGDYRVGGQEDTKDIEDGNGHSSTETEKSTPTNKFTAMANKLRS